VLFCTTLSANLLLIPAAHAAPSRPRSTKQETALSAAAPGGVGTAASHAVGTLQSAANLIVQHRETLAAKGIHLQTVAVDTARQRVLVGVRAGSDRASEHELRQQFPGVQIAVRFVRVLPAAGVGSYMAGPPWITGMEIYKLFYSAGRLYYTECTMGFNVINPSTRRVYVTTAAHCFNNGDTVLHSVGYTAQQVGTVTARSGYGSSADVELVTAQGSAPNRIVIGSNQYPVSAYLPVTPTGTSVCKYGITTGQICGNVVQSTSATVCYSSGCFYNQQQTYNANIGEVAYYGDSGGPVYVHSGGSVIAAGSVSGFEETCNAAGGGCRLDGVMFFTPIRNMQQALGVVP
jgi:hypothetical protein